MRDCVYLENTRAQPFGDIELLMQIIRKRYLIRVRQKTLLTCEFVFVMCVLVGLLVGADNIGNIELSARSLASVAHL